MKKILTSAGGVEARAAGRALEQALDAAERDERDDEEEGDEAHPLLGDEAADRLALRAAHGPARRLRAPRDEARAEDVDEEHGPALRAQPVPSGGFQVSS